MCSIGKYEKYGHLTTTNIYNHVISDGGISSFYYIDLQISSTLSYCFNNHVKTNQTRVELKQRRLMRTTWGKFPHFSLPYLCSEYITFANYRL